MTAVDAWPREEALYRFRIYLLRHGAEIPEVVAAMPSAEALGVALVTLKAEGDLGGGCVGIMDTHARQIDRVWDGEHAHVGEWLVNPYERRR